VLLSVHNALPPYPETLRGSWVAHRLRLNYVSSSGTRDRLCGKFGSYAPPYLFHFPAPCLSVPKVQISPAQITEDLSGSSYILTYTISC
jgi:hypothetical protein